MRKDLRYPPADTAALGAGALGAAAYVLSLGDGGAAELAGLLGEGLRGLGVY